MHAHTVFYDKGSEGAEYADSTTGNTKLDDGVVPGKIQKYTWIVTQAGTPADGDPNCLTWLYHSHIKPTPDINSGPIGRSFPRMMIDSGRIVLKILQTRPKIFD